MGGTHRRDLAKTRLRRNPRRLRRGGCQIATESFVDTNIHGTMNVLEGAPRSGVKRIVHTSTGEVYGTPASVPIRETHPLNAQLQYAATKIAADQLSGRKRSAPAARHATRPDLCERPGWADPCGPARQRQKR